MLISMIRKETLADGSTAPSGCPPPAALSPAAPIVPIRQASLAIAPAATVDAGPTGSAGDAAGMTPTKAQRDPGIRG